MSGQLFELSLLLGLLALIGSGFGVLIWLSSVPAEQMTPARNDLMELADTVVKVTFGAIVVYMGTMASRRYRQGSSGRPVPPNA